MKAFSANKDNLMLEFSATIPNEKSVLEKYKDKIIYKYDLETFCNNGYSKRIFLERYENTQIEVRFLGALLLSLYRELVAQEHNIMLKPVILFKSESIKSSIENHKKLIGFLENISEKTLQNFYENITEKSSEMLQKSKKFFMQKFGDCIYQKLLDFLRSNFKENYMLNTNDEKELSNNQKLLNSLEQSSNVIRIIFAVDKLNEGWDVLNLFDIVRLRDKRDSKALTTKEAQLIGRGARYFPFILDTEEMQFNRKFDNNTEHSLSCIEKLTYHTLNDVEFIRDLNSAMQKQGLLIENDIKKITLNVNPKLKTNFEKNRIFYAKNERVKKGESRKINSNDIKAKLTGLRIPLFAEKIIGAEIFKDIEYEQDCYKSLILKDTIKTKYFLKALNIEQLDFRELAIIKDCKSRVSFIENVLGELELGFHENQEFNAKTCLEIAQFIIKNAIESINKIKQEYDVSDFKAYELKDKGSRSIYRKIAKDEKITKYDWLLYDALTTDSGDEMEFLNFINSKKDEISKEFSQWFVLRNENFSEFKIYNNIKESSKYGVGFEPDFVFFGKRNGSDEYFGIECFMEVKGKHLAENDDWKEKFLEVIKGKKFDIELDKYLKIQSLPFFIKNGEGRVKFNNAFSKFINSKES